MRGPTPKDPALRQRRNRPATRATLPTAEVAAAFAVPALPAREKLSENWHPLVTEWWGSVWTSPMASEYLDSDKRELFLLAELHQQFWTQADVKVRIVLAGEIRQRSVQFGLTPIDRRRLQWEIEKGEKAEDATKTRRQSRDLRETSRKDPRDVLKLEAS